jgi:radical SAM superfamily enzyme YgiQ (UPF0313 family)
MHICLIVPPSIFLLDERVFMNLGVLKVAASLEQGGHQVEVLDLSGVENYEDVVRDHAAQTQAQVFGITATTPQMPAALKVRRALGDRRVILGGPHPTLVHAAWKGENKRGVRGRACHALEVLLKHFDVVVAGDGEAAIHVAIQPETRGIVDADLPGTDLFLTNTALDHTPMPARHLVDAASYKYTIDGHQAMSLICQLGCPFGCGFCGGRESAMLRRVRTRSSANVVAEIEHLHLTYGVTGFMLYDDELNVNPKMVELMDMIYAKQVELGVEFRLRGFIKSQLFTDAQAAAMARAGFKWILVGFESGSPRILENIEKKATVEQNTRCMDIARRHGLKVKALMSVGHPGESAQTIQETEDWLLAQRPDDFDVTVITTYPGTPYYDRAVETAPGIWTYTYPKNGDRLHAYELDYTQVADYYKGDPDGGYKAYVFTDHLDSAGLVVARDLVEKHVRATLKIPYNVGHAAQRYEHSMGQLPPSILRSSAKATSGV